MVAAAPKHQREPVAWVRDDGDGCLEFTSPGDGIGYPVYRHADPGEAERFEKLYTQALSRQADIGVELAVAHVLLRKAFFALLKAGHSKPLREHIKKILPIALCSTCNGYGKYQDGDSGTDEDGRAPNIVECDCDDSERMPQYRSNAEPSAPVEIDERTELKPDAWRASINGNWEYFRSYDQALRELREWQSDYLPEELEEAKADGLCEPEPVYSRAALERKP